MGDPMGEGVGFSGPRSSDDQQRRRRQPSCSPVLDRTPLLGIEGFRGRRLPSAPGASVHGRSERRSMIPAMTATARLGGAVRTWPMVRSVGWPARRGRAEKSELDLCWSANWIRTGDFAREAIRRSHATGYCSTMPLPNRFPASKLGNKLPKNST